LGKDLAPSCYAPFLEALKRRIRETQIRATLAANRELIPLLLEHWA
jgi:hypothetical protein